MQNNENANNHENHDTKRGSCDSYTFRFFGAVFNAIPMVKMQNNDKSHETKLECSDILNVIF